MLRSPRLLLPPFLAFMLALGAACSESSVEPSPLASPAPAKQYEMCPLRVVLRGTDGVLASHSLEIRAMEQSDERSWRAVEIQQLLSNERGEINADFPCGLRLSLHSSGWMWASQPDRVVVGPDMKPLEVRLLPELSVRLYVHGGEGPEAKDVRFHRSGDEVGQPVPREGLLIPGLRMSEVAGEIRSSNLPSRSWRPARSDEIETVQPGLVEAVVIMGDIQRSWLQLDDALDEAVEGALCISEGTRGKSCKLYQGVWRCPCGPPASLGLYGPRWDVGLIRPLTGPDMQISSLPDGETLCLDLPQVKVKGASLLAQPSGIEGGVLLGGLPRQIVPGRAVCLKLPHGEAIDVTLRGSSTGLWTLRSEGQGTLELSSR
jgi:hypothetical protein